MHFLRGKRHLERCGLAWRKWKGAFSSLEGVMGGANAMQDERVFQQ